MHCLNLWHHNPLHVRNHSPSDKVSNPRRFGCSATPFWGSHISQICNRLLTNLTLVYVLVYLFIKFVGHFTQSSLTLCTNQLTSLELLVLEFSSGSVGQNWTDGLCY